MNKNNKCEQPNCTNQVTEKTKQDKWKRHCSSSCKNKHNSLKSREKAKATHRARTGVDNPMQDPAVHETMKKNSLEKHGTEWACQSEQKRDATYKTMDEKYDGKHWMNDPKVQDKLKATNQERYGVDNAAKHPDVRAKMVETNQKRYGHDYTGQVPEIVAKTNATNLERYGGHPFTNEEVKAKKLATTREKYGVDNISQCPEIHEKKLKTGYNAKEYEMPSGDIRVVQGYEPLALDELLQEGYTEDQIKTSGIKGVPYKLNGKDHVYHPDIEIPHENKLIEVKSDYTKEANLEKNLAKEQGSIDAGFDFEFREYNNKGKRI